MGPINKTLSGKHMQEDIQIVKTETDDQNYEGEQSK